MTASRAFILAAALATIAAGQTYTSPPPICFAFNDTPPPATYSSYVYASYSGSLLVHFTAPVTTTVERLDLWTQGGSFGSVPPSLRLELMQTPSLGAPPAGAVLATFSGPAAGFSYGWTTCPLWFSGPAVVTAGATYALSFRAYPA